MYLEKGFTKYQEFIDAAKNELGDIDSPGDKIKFINTLLDSNNSEYSKHLPECTNPTGCPQNYAYEKVAYYLTRELNRLGVKLDDDTFTQDEKNQAESKLDQILKDLNEVKLGQQIIYEDLTKEINELRDLYFLGKKKWYQLFLGKSIDMIASGIVSETISKQIIETVKSMPTLLEN
jgi:hypothetical protein